MLRESPTAVLCHFHARLQAFVYDWPRRAGWPRLVRYDRGTRDRGVFSSILIENGVMIRPAGLGIPEQINDENHQGYARFRLRIEGHDSLRMLAKLPCKSMRILRSMGSRRTTQTHCIRKGRTCDRISTSWQHGLVLQRITGR